MKIYMGFSKPTTKFPIFGWIIQWVEARPYDHCYVRFQEPIDGEYMIYQASKEMVNLFNKDIFLASNESVKEYELDISDVQYALLWKHIKSNLGVPYSLLEDFGILLMKIFKLQNNPFNAGGSADFCSKEMAIVCNVLGFNVSQSVNNVDPSLMDKILSTKGFPCIESPKF